MGDGARYALTAFVSGGMPHNPNYVPRKRPRADCPHCGKSCEITEGMPAHIKAKHPEMLRARSNQEGGE